MAQKRRAQRGMTLLEVLVSMLLMGGAIVGSIAMIQTSERYNEQANNQKMALYAAQDIIGKMRANAKNAGEYLSGTGVETDCFNQICSGRVLAQNDLFNWHQTLQLTLPDVDERQTKVVASAYPGEYTVTIAWRDVDDAHQASSSAANDGVSSLVLPFAL